MPSSFLEATKQPDGSSEPSQQLAASGGIGARTIVLTFPGSPSCCTEIVIDFEDDRGSDSKGTQSEEAEMWPPQHDLPATAHEESDVSPIPKPSEDDVAHEFDQSTVYIGLDSGLTVGRKKARKKTDSLVRTLPILAHCSKRWLHFRGKKSHDRGRTCAFESGDVGKKIDTSLSVDDRNDSPRKKFDTKQTFVSPRAPFSIVNPKATLSMTASHDRRKSLERSQETKAVKYSSRKSKSGVGISEMKQEITHGEEIEMVSTKKKYDLSIDQLRVDKFPQIQVSSGKRNAQVEFDISSGHEKVKKCGECRFSEINKDHCKVRGDSDVDRLPAEGVQLSSQNSFRVPGRVPSPSASNLASTGHRVLDTMFIDVIKLMLAQEDPDNAKTSSPSSEHEENRSLQTTVGEANSRQQTKEHSAVGNNKIRNFDKDIVFDNLNLREGASLTKNVQHACEASELNFPAKTQSCERNVSGDRSFSSHYTTTGSDSNNCHLCCGGDVHERKELTTVVDAASCSDDSLRGSLGSNDELPTSKERNYDVQEGGTRTREMSRSLQVKLQSMPVEKHNGRRCRNSGKNTETRVVSVIARSPEIVQSSSDDNLSSLHHCEASGGASNCDVSEESVLDSVAAKEKRNSAMFSNENDALHSENLSAGIVNDASAHSHITYQRVIDESSMGNNHVYSATSAQGCSGTYAIGQTLVSRSMATEEEEDSESQLCSTEIEPLANETGTRKSIHEFSVVAIKSSKLQKFFSESSYHTDSTDCFTNYHQTPGTSKSSGKIHSSLGKLHSKTPLVSVNSTFEDKESRLDEPEKPVEDCRSATLLATGSTGVKVPPLIRRFITLEKHKGRLSFASSFIGKAKIALSRIRSRSLSPAAVGMKIKSMFFRDTGGQALPKKPTVTVGPKKIPRHGTGSKQGKSTKQCVGPKKGVVSKKGRLSRQTTGSKQQESSSAISKELHLSKTTDIDIRTRANQAAIRDGPLAKEQRKLHSKGSHLPVQISLKLEHNRQNVFRSGKVNTPHSKETKPRRCQSYTDITRERKFSGTVCAKAIPESATSDNSSPSDLDLSDDLRRRITHYLGSQYKNLEQARSISPPFTMVVSPVLESIAEADSASEESKSDGEVAQLKCEWLFAKKGFMKDSLSKVATLGCDDGPCPVSAVGVTRGQHTRGRKPALRMSSSYEDCKSESGDLSLYNSVCIPALMKTHSLVSNLEAAQSELLAINGIAIISQEVKMKRYPSFPNLTDINDGDYSITSVKTSGSNTFTVSVNTFEKDPFAVREYGEIKHTNSSQTGAFSAPNTRLECNMIKNDGCTMKQNTQTEFSPNLVEQGKLKSGIYPCSQQFTLIEGETQENTSFCQSGNSLGNCEVTVSCSRHLATEYNVKSVQPENSVAFSTPEINRSEIAANLLSLGAEMGRTVTEPVSKQIPYSPDNSINEMLNDCVLVDFDHENIPTSSKLMSATDNCGCNLQMLRGALLQDDFSEAAGVLSVKDVNDTFQREGRQLLKEDEEISLAIACNYFPFERRQFDSQGNVENEQLSCLKQEEHVDEDICCTNIDENNWSRNTVVEHKNDEDGINEGCVKICRENFVLSQAGEKNVCYCEDREMDGDNHDTSHSINTTNEVSTIATYEIPTNATIQLSTKSTNRQHSANNTSQLCTNTTNQELYEITQSQCDVNKYAPSLEKNNHSNDDTIDPRMMNSSLVDPNTSVTLRENFEDYAASCGSRMACVEHVNPRDGQYQFVCDASLLVTAETAYNPADDGGAAAAVRRKSTSPGSFRHNNESGNVLRNAFECKKDSTVQAKTVLDAYNFCLSDVGTKDQTPYADSVTLAGQKLNTATTACSKKTGIHGKSMKIYNKTCVLHFAASKTKPAKSETILLKTAKAKKKKQGCLQSAADIPKRCPIGKKDTSRNMKSTTNNGFSKCGAKISDVDISSFNTPGGGKQFVVTSVSSIFGAQDERPIFGLKSVRDLVSRNVNVLKVQSEAIDREDSGALTISGKNQTQNFNITKDLKSQYNSFENELPTVDSKLLNGQMVNIVQVAKTDVNINLSSKSSPNSASSCVSVDDNKLDITVRPDNASDILNQINLNHSDRKNPYTPGHVLNTNTSFYECAGQEAPVPLPVKRLGGTMPKRLSRRVSWSDRPAPTKDGFTNRTQYHLRRCDELLQRSTGILRRSQEMTCRVHRQMEHSAEELKLMNYGASRQPE